MDPFDFFNSDSESSEDEVYDCDSSSNSDSIKELAFNYDHSVPKSSEVLAKTTFPKNIIKKLMHRETHGFFSPMHNLRHFDKVPAENCLRLSEILPKTYPRQQHVCMGLTRCGNFLMTYTLLPEMGVHYDENYHYELHWWRFVPHRRCVKLSSTQLFQSRAVDVELHITVCQWPNDNSRLLVYGFETEVELTSGSGRAHVSVLTVPPVARCADCQRASPEPRVESERDGPCLRHGLTVHASFDHGAPCPPFNAKLSLKRDGLVIINIGHLLHVLDIRLDLAVQQPAAPTPPPPTPATAPEPAETEAVWSDDENALLRMLDQNFLDVNHELSIACADYDDPAYRIRDGPDSPEEPRLPEKQPRLCADSRSPRDREESRDRRPRRFVNLTESAARASVEVVRPAPEALLPVAGRAPTATAKYTTLFDRHYVERDWARPPDPHDNDEEDGEAPAYQFALLMVVQGARNEAMQLATPRRPGKPGAASVIVGQKSLDCEQFLNDIGEAVCSEMGLVFRHCVDYHLDISDVCPVTGEARCEARLRLKFSLRPEQRCRLGDCACTFVLHTDTGTVGVVSVSSLVQAGFEGRESCELHAPPRGPRGPALPSAGRVRVINNEGTLRYVSFTALVDLDNLIEIRL